MSVRVCAHFCRLGSDTHKGSVVPCSLLTSSDSVGLWVVALGSHSCLPAQGAVLVSHLSLTHTRTHSETPTLTLQLDHRVADI